MFMRFDVSSDAHVNGRPTAGDAPQQVGGGNATSACDGVLWPGLKEKCLLEEEKSKLLQRLKDMEVPLHIGSGAVVMIISNGGLRNTHVLSHTARQTRTHATWYWKCSSHHIQINPHYVFWMFSFTPEYGVSSSTCCGPASLGVSPRNQPVATRLQPQLTLFCL